MTPPLGKHRTPARRYDTWMVARHSSLTMIGEAHGMMVRPRGTHVPFGIISMIIAATLTVVVDMLSEQLFRWMDGYRLGVSLGLDAPALGRFALKARDPYQGAISALLAATVALLAARPALSTAGLRLQVEHIGSVRVSPNILVYLAIFIGVSAVVVIVAAFTAAGKRTPKADSGTVSHIIVFGTIARYRRACRGIRIGGRMIPILLANLLATSADGASDRQTDGHAIEGHHD